MVSNRLEFFSTIQTVVSLALSYSGGVADSIVCIKRMKKIKLNKMDNTTNQMDKAYYFQHSISFAFLHSFTKRLTYKKKNYKNFISFKSHHKSWTKRLHLMTKTWESVCNDQTAHFTKTEILFFMNSPHTKKMFWTIKLLVLKTRFHFFGASHCKVEYLTL